MDAIDFLIKNKVLISRDIDKPFQMNLTRDGNIKSVHDIITAMDEYCRYKINEIESRTEAKKTVGGYLFPNKESADKFIKYCKENNIKY